MGQNGIRWKELPNASVRLATIAFHRSFQKILAAYVYTFIYMHSVYIQFYIFIFDYIFVSQVFTKMVHHLIGYLDISMFLFWTGLVTFYDLHILLTLRYFSCFDITKYATMKINTHHTHFYKYTQSVNSLQWILLVQRVYAM